MNNSKKKNFGEVPLPLFARMYPGLIESLCPIIDVNDSDYMVRFNNDRIEIGYVTDEWNEFSAS